MSKTMIPLTIERKFGLAVDVATAQAPNSSVGLEIEVVSVTSAAAWSCRSSNERAGEKLVAITRP